MGLFSRMESKMEDTIEGAADKLISAPISPVQISKQCEKQMKRNKMVGAGKQIAPTLYTVLVNVNDDHRLFGYYPTLAGETETYISARAHDLGFSLDGKPLVRFIADPACKQGKFDVIAECVASPIVSRLRDEEMQRYGLGAHKPRGAVAGMAGAGAGAIAAAGAAGASAAGTAGTETPAQGNLNLPQAQPLRARLTNNKTGEQHKLGSANVSLGRESENTIIISDMGASRFHASIERKQNGWVLTDQNSTNGTIVNGHEISSAVLHNGDVITIGTTDYVFTFDTAEQGTQNATGHNSVTRAAGNANNEIA